ncbi:hypothetical protein ACIG3E_37215 [Streptomyces sp. NPDC053474]|uniref:hypothetical protein n=1 Tax=Streptomyces sp. NPDC053474 TaxID=3365704 RepID=UPI0037CE90DD
MSAVLGGTQVPVPSLEDGGGTVGIPFRRDLPLLSAVFLATLWSGPMAAHEQLGSYVFHRARVQLLIGGVLMASCLSLTAETLAVDAAAGLIFVRARSSPGSAWHSCPPPSSDPALPGCSL